ncbi:hypothetical protein [Roseovarius rhodophyticola]|uniref:Bacterial dipeptidyl-peptidase SH3 domain-containing protein n=1 Tax=Roseovarius rhodophyticola TaxID=3080827 RepID=A0ABZ2TAL3_9RHOB|nr:hypothetical protein [Roseovarius sp. W115]MDV2930419.1 hypothetical protein [Roseovarius sp. W115]
MNDRRRTPFNGKVAAAHLKGLVDADRYVEAEPKHVAVVTADLCTEPGGARDRQLLRGEAFMCLDVQEAWVFGYAEKDGYVGWVEAASLNGHPSDVPTHRVASARSYGKSTPGLKEMGRVTPFRLMPALLWSTKSMDGHGSHGGAVLCRVTCMFRPNISCVWILQQKIPSQSPNSFLERLIFGVAIPRLALIVRVLFKQRALHVMSRVRETVTCRRSNWVLNCLKTRHSSAVT